VVNASADGFLVKNWKFGRHIRTGPDGVNNSDTTGDDVTLIPKGTHAAPDVPAITPGANGTLDSTAGGDDTVQDGLFIGSTYPYVLFTGTSVFGPFGNPGGDVATQPGIPGQSNPKPPPYFFNHFVVKYGGQVYDPSYGAGPFGSELAHENAAIDGIKSGVRAKKNAATQELVYTRAPSLE